MRVPAPRGHRSDCRFRRRARSGTDSARRSRSALRRSASRSRFAPKREALLNDLRCNARYGTAADDIARLHQDASNLVAQLIPVLGKSYGKFVSRQKTRCPRCCFCLACFLAAVAGLPAWRRRASFRMPRRPSARRPRPKTLPASRGSTTGSALTSLSRRAVLYNQGNAWMRAGATGRALAAYRQAQRYRPRDPYLAANLQNALAASGRNAAAPNEFRSRRVRLLLAKLAELSGKICRHRLCCWQ